MKKHLLQMVAVVGALLLYIPCFAGEADVVDTNHSSQVLLDYSAGELNSFAEPEDEISAKAKPPSTIVYHALGGYYDENEKKDYINKYIFKMDEEVLIYTYFQNNKKGLAMITAKVTGPIKKNKMATSELEANKNYFWKISFGKFSKPGIYTVDVTVKSLIGGNVKSLWDAKCRFQVIE
jgi:hypothetical protein